MSDNLLYTLNTLKILCSIKNKKLRNAAVFHLLHCPLLRKSLHEIAINITKKNLPLSKAQKRGLKKYQEVIYLISKKNWPKPLKRITPQIGGFLPIILPLLLELFERN